MRRSKTFYIILIIIAAAIIGLFAIFYHHMQTPPNIEQTTTLLNKTLQAESYRFSISAEVGKQGSISSYFDLNGECSNQGSRLQGEVLGDQVELIFLDGKLWRRTNNKEWECRDIAEINSAAELFCELLPTEIFSYDTITSYSFLGRTKDGSKTTTQLQLIPQAAGWVGKYFYDVSYTLNCDRRCKQINSIVLSAMLKDDPDFTLLLTASFYDQDAQISITAPQ